MTRRLIMLLAVLLLAGAAQAQDTPDARVMARWFPADTVLFAAVRTDEAFIEQLDALSQAIAARPLIAQAVGLPPWTFREALREALPDEDEDLDLLLAWLGDYAAFGVTRLPAGGAASWYFAAPINNRAAAQGYLERTLAKRFARAEEGGYTVYVPPSPAAHYAVGDDVLLVYGGADAPPAFPVAQPLGEDADFIRAAGGLAAAQYNALLYLDFPALSALAEAEADAAANPVVLALLDQAGPLAVGLTILDGSTLAIDTAQALPAGAAPAPPVDPNFARFIPPDASAAIVAHDLSSLWESLGSLSRGVNALAGAQGGTVDFTQQAAFSLRLAGINLQQDLLSWATGEYALFLRTDLVDVAGDLVDGRLDSASLDGRVDFGLLVEATDAAQARAFAARIGALLARAGARAQQGISVSRDTLSGVDVTVVSVEAPLDGATSFNFDLVVGATDDVFFTATRPAALAILSGSGGLNNQPAFTEALAYALPGASSFWYTNGQGLVTVLGGVGGLTALTLLGPAIGPISSSIIVGLAGGTPVPTPTPPPPMVGGLTPDEFVRLLREMIEAASSGGGSAVVTADGLARLRLTLTVSR